MLVQTLRSIVFYVVFFIITAVIATSVGLMSKITPNRKDLGLKLGLFWGSSTLFALRWIVGVRTEVTGTENIPAGACIFGSKHQSDWDIYALLPYAQNPAYVAKQELLNIPVFGWAAAWINTIGVDRKRGKEAFSHMLEQAKDRLAEGCRVIIYPEGTRRKPFAEPAYKSGLSRLYVALDAPVVPVALTSGLYWPRNSLVLWPGTARAHFLPAIPAGLSQEEFQEQLILSIETKTNEMLLEDAEKGLSRPINAEMRANIKRMKALRDTAQ